MTKPAGFIDQDHPHFVCKLNKSIYGLRQAPWAWFKRFNSFLLQIGFVASESNASLFIFSQGKHGLYLLVYVDDLVLRGSNSTLIDDFVIQLK